MQPKPLSLVRFLPSLALTFLLMGWGAQAADKNVDPTGTWTWSRPGRDGGPERTTKLTLKWDGEKLTGKLLAPGRGGELREAEIQKGKVNGNEIAFVVIREFNGNQFTTKYMAKIDGDNLKGKMEFERNGESRSRDWEAKRVPAKK